MDVNSNNVWIVYCIFAVVYMEVSNNIDAIRDLMEQELLRSIDKKSVVGGTGMSRTSDRLYVWVDALMRASGGCLRYDSVGGSVMVFDGKVWVGVVSYGREVSDSLMCKVARDVLLRVDPSIHKGDLMSCEKRLGKAIVDGAMMSVMGEGSSYVGFQNGVWDFSDPLEPVRHGFGERLPIRELREYDYDPGARCPEWEAFLGNTLGEADMRTLQMFFGLGVKARTGLGHSVEKMLWMVGSGGNGKSTCLDVLEHVYGGGLFSHASLPTLLDGNVLNRMLGTSPIIGRRYNRCDEIQMSDITKKTDLLKRLCSADHVEYRRIKGNASSSNEIPFFVFSMNRMPSSRSTDEALLRRLLIVRFKYSVRAEDMDTGLCSRLCKESSGIWNWCLEGYRKLVEYGFRFPRSKDNEVEQRKMMMASGQQMEVWLQDEGMASVGRTRLQNPYRVLLNTLWDRYKDWCERNDVDIDVDTPRAMAQMMGGGARGARGLGYVKKRCSAGVFFEVYSDKKIEFGV